METRRIPPLSRLLRGRARFAKEAGCAVLLAAVSALPSSCAGAGAAADGQGSEPAAGLDLPAVDLSGHRIIGCCCPTPCPCRLNRKPTYHHGCDYTTAVHLEHGTIDGVRMDGVSFVFVGGSFAEDTGDDWAGLYVDEGADDRQLAALLRFLGVEGAASRRQGREPYLVGAFEGLRRAPVRYAVDPDGLGESCTIDGVLDLRTRAIVNPGRSTPVVSTGVLDSFGETFVHAECLAHVYRDPALEGRAHDLTGRQANFAAFHIGDAEVRRLARGALGWSCWSAHADLGDDRSYEEDLVRVGHD